MKDRKDLDKFILQRLSRKPTNTNLVERLRTVAQQKMINLKK